MDHRRVRPRRRWLGVPLLSVVALVVGAGPAAAAETIQGSGAGAGYGTITGHGQPGEGLCLPVGNNSEYVIDVAEGSVSAAEGTAVAEYAGPLTVTIALSGTRYYFNPAGTFSDNTCETPAAIPATISVTGSNLAGSVDCPGDDGGFQRVNTTVTFQEVGNDGDGSCTVTSVSSAGGLTTVTVSPVTHAFAGNEYPCLIPPSPPSPPGVTTCPSPTDQVHVQGEWTVTGADTTN